MSSIIICEIYSSGFQFPGDTGSDQPGVEGSFDHALGPAGFVAGPGGWASPPPARRATCEACEASSRWKWPGDDGRREEVGRQPASSCESHGCLSCIEDWQWWTAWNRCIWEHGRSACTSAWSDHFQMQWVEAADPCFSAQVCELALHSGMQLQVQVLLSHSKDKLLLAQNQRRSWRIQEMLDTLAWRRHAEDQL